MTKLPALKRIPLRFMLYALCFVQSCGHDTSPVKQPGLPDQFIAVLGIMQDAGYPQAGCDKECCNAYWKGAEEKKLVTCLALVDRKANQYWLFEATPDITTQFHSVQQYLSSQAGHIPAGIFTTHAHIGHYAGLLQLGREAMGARSVPVWTMPRMDSFLRYNAPWSQLVELKNIQLNALKEDSSITLSPSLKVKPLVVPHRDEFSETVGFIIESAGKKILFIPDIDKWEKWDRDINEEVSKVDIAFLDGTFYKNGELPGRDMKEVPHPFVEESMQLFAGLPDTVRSKIVFIHFNHTNPLRKKGSSEKEEVSAKGFKVAEEGMIIPL